VSTSLGRRRGSSTRSLASSDGGKRLHEVVCREHGFEIVDVPPGSVARRAAMVAERIGFLSAPGR
jgi:hypothetical protein